MAERDGTLRDLRGMDGLVSALPTTPFAPIEPTRIPAALASTLGVPLLPRRVPAATETDSWTRDGVDGIALRWDAGFGPATDAWLLRPAGETTPLPGVVALHCHGGMKYFGKEKIADGPADAHPQVAAFRAQCYDGRPLASDLARAGFSVLVPDAVGWGSRRVAASDMPTKVTRAARFELDRRASAGEDIDEPTRYDIHAGFHEDVLAKTLGVLGTSWGGVIAHGDLVAIDLLRARPDTAGDRVAAVGFSGGGARAVIASTLSDYVHATAAIAMMSTFDAMLDGLMHGHSWTLMNPGMATLGDWPDVAAARAPRPLFVGYAERDPLFPLAGMRAADELIAARYGDSGGYTPVWEDQPHAIGPETQRALREWLRTHTALRS